MTILSARSFAALTLFSLILVACGSSGGGSTPPSPPAPVAPAPPPPEPTFEERLADWAAHDTNDCRAKTPGFEALGGWLKNDGRELGKSRVWVGDQGSLSDPDTHGARVWATFSACAVRETEDQYARSREEGDITVSIVFDEAQEDGRDLIVSRSLGAPYQDIPLPDPVPLSRFYAELDGAREGQRILYVQAAGNEGGKRTGELQTPSFQGALEQADTALWLLVGGYIGEGDDRKVADTGLSGGSAVCDEAAPLCLFAPWEDPKGGVGTSAAAPQASAALDTVWAVWPDMDVLDLRNLAFDCADNMPAPAGEESVVREYSYLNGRGFTSATNSRWGHGILSLTCLFTPNGGLQDPTTGNAISGGIYGPLAGPVAGASVTGVDYTGRDFGYGFARPVARQNHALAATANLSASGASSAVNARGRGPGAFRGTLWAAGRTRVDLTAAGNALGAAAQWQAGGLTLRGGFAVQPEGAGSLTGSRAFRAPSTVSAAITAAYGRTLPRDFSAHLQADHWRTLATHGRSLWDGAQLRESRISAALVKRVGSHEFALQGVWRSGLSGTLGVSGRSWALGPRTERGVWLTWSTS